jgi:hypothetical protein
LSVVDWALKSMSRNTLRGLAAAIFSTSLAWYLRGHGHSSSAARLPASISTITMSERTSWLRKLAR